MLRFAGAPAPLQPRTTLWFWNTWRAWPATRCRSILNPGRWPESCTTSIFCASTAAMPITDRSNPNESCSAGTEHLHPGSSLARRPCDHHFLFRAGAGHRLAFEGTGQYRGRLLHGRPGNDGMGSRAGGSVGEPGLARGDGLGGERLEVWHSRGSLVLDRSHPGDAISVLGDDALLPHL